MLQVITKKPKSPKFSFFDRVKLAISAFNVPALNREIKLGNGLIYDIEARTLILPPDFVIEGAGDLTIRSHGHLMLDSGSVEDTDEGREGYQYSIWFNSPKDEFGRPLKDGPDVIDGDSHDS